MIDVRRVKTDLRASGLMTNHSFKGYLSLDFLPNIADTFDLAPSITQSLNNAEVDIILPTKDLDFLPKITKLQ